LFVENHGGLVLQHSSMRQIRIPNTEMSADPSTSDAGTQTSPILKHEHFVGNFVKTFEIEVAGDNHDGEEFSTTIPNLLASPFQFTSPIIEPQLSSDDHLEHPELRLLQGDPTVSQQDESIIGYFWLMLTMIFSFMKEYLKGFFQGNKRREINRLQSAMENSLNYSQWESHAKELDQVVGWENWKSTKLPKLYDYSAIDYWINQYQYFIEIQDFQALTLALRTSLMR
jgi:hypothetical protein